MPPGYPSYVFLCPLGYPSLLTPWVAVIGSLAWGLWIETALLIGGTLWLSRRQLAPRGSVLSIGIVAAAALTASIADRQTAQSDVIACHTAVFIEPYSFQHASEIFQAQRMFIAQANIALWLAVGLFLLGTLLTARVFVLGWRRRR